MPLLSRAFIRAGMIYFVLALIVGGLTVAAPVFKLPSSISVLYPVYIHLLMVGWVTQLIIGVAYWMFPKFSKERPRRSERFAWAAFFLLNGGLILRAFGEPLVTLKPEWGIGWLLAVSAIMQALGGWAFVINTWSRVKER